MPAKSRFWQTVDSHIADLTKFFPQAFQATVTEIDPDGTTGTVRVARGPDDPAFERAPSYLVGDTPTVGDEVLVLGNAYYSWAITGGGGGGTDDQTAAEVPYSGSTTLSATNVEAALDELDTEKVPSTRTISTTAPLSGGGDLSANRTLAVSAATETASGVVELATSTETTTGTDTARATHPAGVKAAVDAHVALSDPHAQYQKESEKDQNSGYVGLGAAQGTRDGTKFLRDDGTWQAVAGGSSKAVGAFSAYKSAAQDNITSSTFIKVQMDAESFDVSGWYDNTTNYRYTPLTEGYYAFTGSVQLTPGVTDQRVVCILYKNGARFRDFGQFYGRGTSTYRASGAVGPVYANGTTDYFEMYVWHDFGVNTSDISAVDFATHFSGHFIGTP